MTEIGDTCPDCGLNIATAGHFVACPEQEQEFDGNCAMCGEPYTDFFEHLSECDVRGDEETKVSSTDDEAEWDTGDVGL